jgi:hypothetical protein
MSGKKIEISTELTASVLLTAYLPLTECLEWMSESLLNTNYLVWSL